MHRREFVVAGLSSLLTYSCSCAQKAEARSPITDCRAAASGAVRIRGIQRNQPDPQYQLIAPYALEVHPAVFHFDDGDAPNAFAMPRRDAAIFSTRTAILGRNDFPERPDGTVFIGLNLWKAEWRRQEARAAENKDRGIPAGANVEIIAAHEFGHILQYKNGMTPNGPWQMEPHADFLAGWCMGQSRKSVTFPLWKDVADIEAGARAIFEYGDTDFFDRGHHGEPDFRAAMIRAGFDAYELDVNAAFEKGRKIAGIN